MMEPQTQPGAVTGERHTNIFVGLHSLVQEIVVSQREISDNKIHVYYCTKNRTIRGRFENISNIIELMDCSNNQGRERDFSGEVGHNPV